MNIIKLPLQRSSKSEHQSMKNEGKMNKTLGSILSIAGLIGLIFFGYQYMADTESFQLFGADIAISTGDIVPVVISAIVLIVGLVLYRSK
jgi:hypothetical protein